MEGLVVIGVIWFFLWLFSSGKSSSAATDTAALPTRTPATGSRPPSGDAVDELLRISGQRFRAKVEASKKAFDDIDVDVFQISMAGAIEVPYDNYLVRHSVTAVDVTAGDDKPLPILCIIDALQVDDGLFFGFVSSPTQVPYKSSLIKEYMNLLAVPVESLVLPYKGTRKILFVVSILHGSSSNIICTTEATISHYFPETGYMEAQENHMKAAELTVMLAMAVSASDGHVHVKEGEVVKEWIRRQIAAAAEPSKEELKDRLNKTAKDAFGMINAGDALDIYDLCSDLDDVATTAQKYDILELCMKVVSADGKARESEFLIINKIAEHMEIDMDKFRSMTDKIIPVNIHEVEDAERLLAIPAGSTTEQKKEHLRNEYKKWNPRVTHSDPKIREQATKMLELIAKERSKLS